MRARWLGPFLPLFWTIFPGHAAADERAERVLLVAPPAGLESAVRIALSAWPITVVVEAASPDSQRASQRASQDAGPGATMPGSADRARALAARHGAGAVVWLSDDGAGGRALWIYDRASRRTSARRLTRRPPFDEPTAAAVALSIKTLLRHSSVVPVVERYGVAAARAEIASRPPRLLVDTLASARIRPRGPGAEPRLGVGVRAAPGPVARLGALAARFHVGPGVPVDAPGFTGQFSDLQLAAALAARVSIRRDAGLELWPSLGASLHFTEIEGAVPGQARRARAERVNPTADGGLSLELALSRWPWLRLSASAAGSFALRRQIYLVGGEPVLTLRRVELEIGAAISVLLL
jgi:hypothetical protein